MSSSHGAVAPTDHLIISVSDDEAGDNVNDLRNWLRSDPALRSLKLAPVVVPTEPGEMAGGVLQALEIAVLSKEMLVALAGALGGWLSSRATGRRANIRIQRGKDQFEVSAASTKDAKELVDCIARHLDELD